MAARMAEDANKKARVMRARSAVLSTVARYAASFFASRRARRDFRRAACRLWMMPFAAALSSDRAAIFTDCVAAATSALCTAARALRTTVLTSERVFRLRRRRVRERDTSFFADLMLGN